MFKNLIKHNLCDKKQDLNLSSNFVTHKQRCFKHFYKYIYVF